MKGGKIKPATLDWEDHSGWLYAFVVQGEVKYIGLAGRVLRSRLDDYTYIKNSQTTRLREAIFAELKAGRSVQIYGWKEFKKDALIAEEVRLRATYRPPWNRV